jgi:TolB-like protein
MAQFEAGSYESARTTLQGAVDAGNESGAAFLYLGMSHEELRDWSAAREAYDRYLTAGASSEAVREVRKRLTLIGRNLLRAEAQQALAREADVPETAGVTPGSFAVLPLVFNSDREDLEPLVHALSATMTTDFAVSEALGVVERAQIQALLDEMALNPASYADPTIGVRAGRMLGAEHVFQGVLTASGRGDLQTNADILNVPSTASVGQRGEGAALEDLFDMEKRIVISTIREVLGVELTPAEERAILQNRLSNALAFVAFGRGLREIDRGNYEMAQTELALSVSLDPGSFATRDAVILELTDLLDATAITTADLGGVAAATGEFGLGLLAPPAAATTMDLLAGQRQTVLLTSERVIAGTLTSVTEGVAPTPTGSTLDLGSTEQGRGQSTVQAGTTRDAVQESRGQETVPGATDAQIRIVIQRPGSQP